MEHALDHWPLYGLEVRTPRLTLRYVDDELLSELIALISAGIHDPAEMPFGVPWTDAPSPELEQNALRFHWQVRAETTPASFRIPFAVLVEGTVVGQTDLAASDYDTLRRFETGSWLGREHQGRGIGKEMRLATLTFGFDGLDADVATTAAWHDNGPSLGVTRALGYEPNGSNLARRRDAAVEQLHFRMTREQFAARRRDDVTVHGADAARAFLGISPAR